MSSPSALAELHADSIDELAAQHTISIPSMPSVPSVPDSLDLGVSTYLSEPANHPAEDPPASTADQTPPNEPSAPTPSPPLSAERVDTPGMPPDHPRLAPAECSDSTALEEDIPEQPRDAASELADELGSVPIEALVEQEDLLDKPMDDLITDTLEQKKYRTRAELLNEEDAKALLYWATTIAGHCRKLKAAASRKQAGGQSHFASARLLALYLAFHRVAADKFRQCSELDPVKSFGVRATGSAPTDGWTSFSAEAITGDFPAMELAYEWALAAYRYGKALEQLHRRRTLSPPDEKRRAAIESDKQNAYYQYRTAFSLLMCVIEYERQPRHFTAHALRVCPKIIEHVADVAPTSTDVGALSDMFLVQFSNIIMRRELTDLSVRPLVAIARSKYAEVRNSNPCAVLRHLAKFFEDDTLGRDAADALTLLDVAGRESLHERQTRLDKLLTSEARQRLDESGLRPEEIVEHVDVVISLINWKGAPPCRLRSDYFPPGDGEKPDKDIIWLDESPKKFFTDRYKLSSDEKNPNFSIILAKRKADKLPVAIKVIKNLAKWQKEVDQEIEWCKSLRHPNLVHLLEIYRYEDSAWLVMEYSDAGNLVDLIPVAAMKEEEIAYIAKQILRALNYLHRNGRMHRDLTSDEILLSTRGDVLVADFELALDRPSQRYWLSPELLSNQPAPYGPEVDMWSFGCIVMEMADGQPPYNDIHPLKEFFYTATYGAPQLHKPHKWSAEMRDFLAQAMHRDHSRRASSSQLLNHAFMQKACTREEFAQIVQYRVSWTRW